MRRLPLLLTVLTSAVLSACGGGDNIGIQSTTATTATLPEGIWTGFTTSGWTYNLAVLENGETWGIYHSSGTIFGAFTGTTVIGTAPTTTSTTGTTTTPPATTVVPGTFSGKGLEFFLPARAVVDATYSGTFTRRAALKIQSSGGVSANATYAPQYDDPAIVSVLAGTFNGQSTTATAPLVNQPLVIAANGSITGGTLDCGITGVILPRSPGKGVYNIFVNLQGEKCPETAVGAMRGVAMYDTSTRRLVAATVSTDEKVKDGWFYVGSR